MGLEEDAAILASILEASQPIWRNLEHHTADIRAQVRVVRSMLAGYKAGYFGGAVAGTLVWLCSVPLLSTCA